MKKSDILLRAVSTLALSVALASHAAYAGDATAPQPGASGGSDIQDVIVTAQRRSEKAQDVPTTVYSISADQLSGESQIKRTNDVTQNIANAESVTAGGPIQPRWFLRGLGTNRTDVNTVNPTAIYYDDVVLTNIINQALPLYDLSRVQVLLGPQGTLWGKAANGGAIDFISNPPTFKAGGYATLGYGSNNHQQEQGAINGPLIDGKLAGRLSVYNDQTDGWQKNIYSGSTLGSRDSAVRGQFLATPSDETNVTVNLHARNYYGDPRTFNYFNDAQGAAPASTLAKFYAFNPKGYIATKYGEVNELATGSDLLNEYGTAIKATHDYKDLSLTSTTGFEAADRTSKGAILAPQANPLWAGPGSTAITATQTDYWQATEELRIASPADRKVAWQGGFFGSVEGLKNQAFSDTLDGLSLLKTSAATVSAYDAAIATAQASKTPASVALTGNPFSLTDIEQEKQSYAFFGSSDIHVTDDFKVTAGLRWTIEKIEYDTQYFGTAANAASPVVPLSSLLSYNAPLLTDSSNSKAFSAWTYDISPQYKISDNANSYFKYAHGVTPGSYTAGTPNSLNGYPTVQPLQQEEIDAYETGLKTQWFQKRLTANATLFDYEEDNAITNVPTAYTSTSGPATAVIFRNAGHAFVRGGELSLSGTPLHGWLLGSNIGLLRSEYTSQNGSSNLGLVGAHLPRTPNATVNGFTSYEEELPWGGDIVWAVDANWRSKQYFYPTTCSQKGTGCLIGTTAGTSAEDGLLAQRQYVIANLHITWHPDVEQNRAVELSILNFTNTHYYEHALTATGPYTDRLAGQPINAFLTYTQKF